MENRQSNATRHANEPPLSSHNALYMRVRRVANILWLLFGILEGMIGMRILLKLIGANPGNPFANFVYNITQPFLFMFEGLTNDPAFDNVVLELHSIIALLVYAFVTWICVRMVWLIFYRPEDIRR